MKQCEVTHDKRHSAILATTAVMIGLLFSLASQVAEAAIAGRIIIAKGAVHALRTDGTARSLAKDSVVYDGDVINTGNRAIAQIRFNDGTLIRLKNNSQFRIDEYQHDAESNSLSKAFYSLLKGGFRSVTSMLNSSNRRAYRVRTSMATIGIRGTDYEASLCSGNCNSGKAGTLELHVHQGEIAVNNTAGEFLMRAGDFGFVTDRVSPMQLQPELIAAARDNREEAAATPETGTVPAEDIQELVGEEIISPEIVDSPVEFIGGDALQCIKY